MVLMTYGRRAGGMMGRWVRPGTSRGLSALVILFHPGRCGYATPAIALARDRSLLPSGAPSLTEASASGRP